ncbi:Lrp/AsnC family transcriptional regulator [Pseudomonas sp. P9_31]|uniref:Lrp/AsnC family transcriptional regulator n=1 Tax=Pseudomonas sp. P9_31 TaxID=3043448 RepID=UPI002A3690C1|nr:Lrp/AsnC family transcriptional regulator [Pseudomonas sp. P9_31]WPN60305.1 Lrp/AsnC family transcriptional regulator [Pseudomonas sp. P9_31]
MDDLDRRLINRLQLGLPLVRHPWQALAAELDSSSHELLGRLHDLLEDGMLTRFGPMFDIERLDGAFTLAALAVPEERFEDVAEQLHALPEVAHNYRREHAWNMWFVLACATEHDLSEALHRIETLTGLPLLNLPKEETYHVGLHFPV